MFKICKFFSHTAVSAASMDGSSQISHYSLLVRNRKREKLWTCCVSVFPDARLFASAFANSPLRSSNTLSQMLAVRQETWNSRNDRVFCLVCRYIHFLLMPDARHAETSFIIWSGRIRLRESWKVPDEAKAAVRSAASLLLPNALRQLSGFPESAGCEADKRFSCMVHGRRIHLLPCALLTFRYPVRIADNKSIILQTSAPRNQSCFRAGRQIPHPAHRTLSQTGRSDRFLLLRTPTSAAPVLLPK